jgi:hypothetical protein
VHDLKVHPRDRELIAGTHGRSIWIVDVAPLQQLAGRTFAANETVFFAPSPALQYGEAPVGGESTGHMVFQAPNPVYGAHLVYYNPSSVSPGQMVITDARGDTMQTIVASGAAGVQRMTWNLRTRPDPRAALSPSELRDSIRTAERVGLFTTESISPAVVASALLDRRIDYFTAYVCENLGTPATSRG